MLTDDGDGDTQHLSSSTEEKGAGVTQYLTSSPEEIMEKLALLCGELSAGNSTVLPQIVALLGKLHQEDEISYKAYKCFCEQLGTCPEY